MASENINSFSQNMNRTVQQQANTLAMLTAMQKSLTTNDTFVTYDYQGADGQTIRYQLPSYDSLINRLKAVEESINSLNSGRGSVNLEDGSRRLVSLSSIPHTPDQITGLSDPSTFTVDTNWFFEELMFPGAQVNIDLTGQIEDTADRVRVVRVILNSEDVSTQALWMNDLSANNYDYVSLKAVLDNNGVPYYEDEETLDMPLVSNRTKGTFQITEDPVQIGDNMWYTLDSLNYSTISSDGTDQGQNNILSIGDQLSYYDSIFEVRDINQNTQQVRLKRVNGVQEVGVYSMLNFYEDPFRSKVVNVRFGINEYNVIYVKGITENYNLLANDWSTPIKFYSNDLILHGSDGLQQMTFGAFYNQYIKDFGRDMINSIYENKKSAWTGKIPNAPTLNGNDFRVVQINTQINAAIDTTDVKNTAAEIESVKSQISSLKSTIASQKTDLQSAANLSTYNSIQQQITTNTTDLNNLQTTYSTLVDSFQTIVRENSAITTTPKYHIRGFFPIPEYQVSGDNEGYSEEIIGFDIAYRYIREDNTATQLNTFTYTDNDGVTEITGTFTDWNVLQGPMKTKMKTELGYVWRSENVADGTETNINQIDIAISKGEKVEFKVRSISEAGYPENPLRSEWSNSVIIEFPDTLATGNEIADLITKVNDDALNITINNTLQSIGVITHLDDTIPNSNSVNGMYFKHMAENIAYEESTVDENGITTVNSINLQKKIAEMLANIKTNSSNIETHKQEITSIKTEMAEKHAQYESDISTLYERADLADASIGAITYKFDTFLDDQNQLFTTKLRLLNAAGQDAVSLTSLNQYELFVVNGEGGADNILSNVHAKNLYIHEDGYTTSERLDVVQKFKNIDKSISDIEGHAATTDSSIYHIEGVIVDVAHLEDVSAVQTNVDDVSARLRRIYDGVGTVSADRFIVNGNITIDGTGEMNVNGGPVRADDFIFGSSDTHTSDMLSEINNTKQTLDELQRDFDTLENNISKVITFDSVTQIDCGNINVNGLTETTDLITSNFQLKGTQTFSPQIADSGGNADGEFRRLNIEIDGASADVGGKIVDVINEIRALTEQADEMYGVLFDAEGGGIHVNGVNSESAGTFKGSVVITDGANTDALSITGEGIMAGSKLIADDFVISNGSATPTSLTQLYTEFGKLQTNYKNAVNYDGYGNSGAVITVNGTETTIQADNAEFTTDMQAQVVHIGGPGDPNKITCSGGNFTFGAGAAQINAQEGRFSEIYINGVQIGSYINSAIAGHTATAENNANQALTKCNTIETEYKAAINTVITKLNAVINALTTHDPAIVITPMNPIS